MTDNPTHAIVPIVATDEQIRAIVFNATPIGSYRAAISAAPPHNLVAVDKGELERLRGIAQISLEYIKTGDSNYFQQLEELLK